jgi:hypothetical protein
MQHMLFGTINDERMKKRNVCDKCNDFTNKTLMDVDYAYSLYRDDIERQFHFHHYDSGMVTYKKQYIHLYYV